METNVRARIVNYTISETKAGNPQVEVLFEYSKGDGLAASHHQIRWWGQLTEKSIPYTLKSLHILGYSGKTDADFAKISDGVESGMLDIGKEVDLVLTEEPGQDGKTYLKVKWINDPDRAPGAFKNSMPKDKVRVKLGALNIAGQMAAIRAEMGAPAPRKPTQAPAMREPGEDDVDFDPGF